jgi:hypothetical protein
MILKRHHHHLKVLCSSDMLLAIFWTNGQVSKEKINDSNLAFKFLQKTFFLLDLLAGGRIL